MVQVRAIPAADALEPETLGHWLAELPVNFSSTESASLHTALVRLKRLDHSLGVETADWPGGAAPLQTGLEMLHILAELRLGLDAIIVGLFFRPLCEERVDLAALAKWFGDDVAMLAEEARKVNALGGLRASGSAPVLGQSLGPDANIRRMLVAIVNDVRVALIKLAERTVAMRALKHLDASARKPIAEEVFHVYAPLADRLGIGHLKWELEDLSFRYTHAEAYHRIAKLLDGKRLDRDIYITRACNELSRVLETEGFAFEITGRSKHIYSIWRKMQRKGIGFSQVYDIRALRILVPSVKECYQTLGIVHGLWRNIPSEFDDYIAGPKENGYRSLHTAVIGPDGKILEIQIRTHDMHEEAELGVCAHWNYKGRDSVKNRQEGYERKLAWLRHLLEWSDPEAEDTGEDSQFSVESLQDRVYVFTPKGDVVSLAQGATPVDFAYHVHSDIGHRCRGAKINGVIVPLTRALQTGDRVEILTGNEPKPSRRWLQASTGYVKTTRARARIQQWFKAQHRDDNLAAGRAMVQRSCERLALTSLDYKQLAKRLGRQSVEELFVAVGAAEVSSQQLLRVAEELAGMGESMVPPPQKRHSPNQDSVSVEGVGSMLTHMAQCCRPCPGDVVKGFITKSRGVSVHRAECSRLLTLQGQSPRRILNVSWETEAGERFEVQLTLECYDRQGLLADVTGVLARIGANVTAINTLSNRSDNTAHMRVTLEVLSLQQLSNVITQLSHLDNVIDVHRSFAG